MNSCSKCFAVIVFTSQELSFAFGEILIISCARKNLVLFLGDDLQCLLKMPRNKVGSQCLSTLELWS